MQDLLESRLKMRRDAVYLRSADGIIFRTIKGAIELKGRDIYGTFIGLLPYLDGSIQVCQLTALTDSSQVDTLLDFIRALITWSVVIQRWDGDDEVGDPVSAAFAPQIDFLEHFSLAPIARFRQFRNSRILLVGSGLAFECAGAGLLRNGLATLCLLRQQDVARNEIVQARDEMLSKGTQCELLFVNSLDEVTQCDLVIYASESPDFRLVKYLNDQRGSGQFLPAVMFSGYSLVGPIVAKNGLPCWQCAMLRFLDNNPPSISADFWRQVVLGPVHPVERLGTSTVAAKIMGNTVALEAFKLRVDSPDPESHSKIIAQNLLNLETSVREVFAHPACPLCASQEMGLAPDDGGFRTTAVGALNIWQNRFDELFGIFQRFDDELIEQVPLRLSRVFFSSQSGAGSTYTASAIGWSMTSSDEARTNAIANAILAKAAQEYPGHLRQKDRSQDDCVRLRPSQLHGFVGSDDDHVITDYVRCTDLKNRSNVFVPSGAVHHLLDSFGCFALCPVGCGIGLGIDEAIDDALLSLSGEVLVQEVLKSTLSVIGIKPAAFSRDPEIDFLASSFDVLGTRPPAVAVSSVTNGATIAMTLPTQSSGSTSVTICPGLTPLLAIKRLLSCCLAQVQSVGINGPPFAGLIARPAVFDIRPNVDHWLERVEDSQTPDRAALLSALGDRERFLYCDITPPDVADTATFRVVRGLAVSR
ncbi:MULTISPECIES: TOMM precursor leader peptide-binding protein [unclassified Mesorhizobium]|uniref:TOMM precursor leader peptide-binding protein n=1 Tax=unclassified Mesorhizobium TaxID=325217 RepID=UPI0003CEB1AC|nr:MULTISPECIES: TOMM precursor leader peptide-binding protein [unclassified Mesorhizobium]ESY52063.1 hypothetical protein X745_20870 [Mesorhizobium sp. LNJC374B00]ESY55996.1 hypothetical protein X744_22505 [Mesorhizobium sp. LNJC372A00]WJI81254.1 TOMM precursor leader peptide-binding protein [Mesorhizobium sp. C374B]WJI87773.1 TOMM precursor leader peptide-binding protein [Mesorhizobium sp. C372A]